MDLSPPTSRRSRKPSAKSELYSTVVIHDDDEEDEEDEEEEQQGRLRLQRPHKTSKEDDIYATMVYKDDDDQDDSSLPPLLKRLPKDFGAAIDYDDDEDDATAGDFGTMIVKTDRSRNSNRSRDQSSPFSSSMASLRKAPAFVDRNQGSMRKRADDEDGFSTFVVRSTVRGTETESVSGTVVRRTAGGGSGGGGAGGGFGSSTMGRAVASMQAVGELGFGKQRKGSGTSQGEEGRQMSKISSSSIPDSVTREDPSTKYELLNELGAFHVFSMYICVEIGKLK